MNSFERVAVIGSGISGLAAAWLLSRRCDVTLFERESYIGGHSNTVEVPAAGAAVPVDTGFIVFNEASYPNLVALFQHLGVPTAPTSMSFAVSLDKGRYEYSGTGLSGLFGQPSNLLRPGHWAMAADVFRFFRESRELLGDGAKDGPSLGQYLTERRYSRSFVERHIVPMAAAIWSTPSSEVLSFPAASFVRFFDNHGLLQARNQPIWRTVVGGSREYVRRMLAAMPAQVVRDAGVARIDRDGAGVVVHHKAGAQRFDACVIATHADEALGLIAQPTGDERALLGAFRYQRNLAVLHRDASLMPRRRRLWSSWNYLGSGAGDERTLSLTYWMNNLQPLGDRAPALFVTLNPDRLIDADRTIASFQYAHPMFDGQAMAAQRVMWRLQGGQRTWFCGSYFGYGFHEDGLQAGLAVAEEMCGARRPWHVENPSGRIHVGLPRRLGSGQALEAAE
jgi:predicted NAD/FAD-binding protein